MNNIEQIKSDLLSRAAPMASDVIGWEVKVRTSPTSTVRGVIKKAEPEIRESATQVRVVFKVTLLCGIAQKERIVHMSKITKREVTQPQNI
jgi:hypothetical protein